MCVLDKRYYSIATSFFCYTQNLNRSKGILRFLTLEMSFVEIAAILTTDRSIIRSIISLVTPRLLFLAKKGAKLLSGGVNKR